MTYYGANIGGLADGPATGNVAWTDYNIPDPTVITKAGLDIARLPIKSERFYAAPGYQATLINLVKSLTGARVMVVIDPHDFGNTWNTATSGWNNIGSAPGTGLLMQLLKDVFALLKAAGIDEDMLCMGLQNEPGTSLTDYQFMATCWQPAVGLLRAAGYTGWIEVPVNGSQEAYKVSPSSPYGSSVADPLNRTLLGLHDYGDASNEGLGDASAGPAEMAGRFSGAIAWFRESGAKQGFAGLSASEFGTASTDPVSTADFANQVGLFQAAPDAVWAAIAWTMDPWLVNNGNFLGTAAAPTANLTDLENATTPLVVYLMGDSYEGDAVANISVDGKTVLSSIDVTATRSSAPQAVRVPGVLSAGTHEIGITFVQDAWGGSPQRDRNLYLTAILYDGQACGGCPSDFVALPSAGTHVTTITVPG